MNIHVRVLFVLLIQLCAFNAAKQHIDLKMLRREFMCWYHI